MLTESGLDYRTGGKLPPSEQIASAPTTATSFSPEFSAYLSSRSEEEKKAIVSFLGGQK
jgi:hypothetical protein